MLDYLTPLGYPDNFTNEQVMGELKNMWVKIEEAGLISDRTPPKEKESILRLFWSLSVDVSKSLPMEDQIKETAKLCKDFVDELRGKERERVRKEKVNEEDLQVLGRGSKVTTRKEPEASHTMGDAQRVALERRKLRHSP